MEIWSWMEQCRKEYKAKDDKERIKLTYCRSVAFEYRESDPDRAVAILKMGSQMAEQFGEPWWKLYHDAAMVEAILHFKKDYRNVLDLAVKCALEARKPLYAQYPGSIKVHDNLIAAYLGIDPVGYAEPIQQALDYLEGELPDEPSSDRYLMLGRKRRFAHERDDFAEAMAIARRILALLDRDNERHRADHHAVFLYCDLAALCYKRGDVAGLTEAAARAEELARKVGHQCELSEGLAWQAVAALLAGEHEKASRFCRAASSHMSRLQMPPNRDFYDALAIYYEKVADLERALKVRDLEKKNIAERGQLMYECKVCIRRCELLAKMGRLKDTDVAEARTAAAKLRAPQMYLAELAKAVGQ